MDDVQEIMFYEQEISITDIESFIKGKELKQGIAYPYTPDEFLVQVQERFVGNKFIPLEKRSALVQKIKNIRSGYTPPIKAIEKPFDWIVAISWALSGLGVIISLLGAASIIKKLRIDKETEADIAFGDINNSGGHGSRMAAAYEYEKMVGDVLSELNVSKPLINNTGRDIGYDFEAHDGESEYIVEVKMYKKMLGLGTARDFLGKVNQSGKSGVLVALSGATQRTKELFEKHNKLSSNQQKVYLVTGETRSAVKNQLSKVFSGVASNK
jgi:hypothetical protein